MITFFKHRAKSAKRKEQSVLRPQELIDLSCRKGALSSVSVKHRGQTA